MTKQLVLSPAGPMFQLGIPVVSRVASVKLAAYVPRTSSAFLAGHLLSVKTPDGAVIASLVPQRAWAKYALPKGLPDNGGKVLAIENEEHFVDDFSGEIPSGYGQGVKTLLLSDNVIVKVGGRTSVQKVNYHIHKTVRSGGREHYDIVVTGVKSGTRQWELNIPRGEYKGRYAFVKTNGAMICTRMKDYSERVAKPDYTLRKEGQLTEIDPAKVIVERKVDGSLVNAVVRDTRVHMRSHRDVNQAYYDKLPAIEFLKNQSSFATSRILYPGPDISGTIFQGELYHPDGAARVSGILNSLPPNARAIQIMRGPVKVYVWDILKYKGRDLSKMPYVERRRLYEDVVKEIRKVNKCWDVIEKMPEDANPKDFYEYIVNDGLPHGEGIVVKPKDGTLETANHKQHWDKFKATDIEHFKLVEVREGVGKFKNSVGRLYVENYDTGARGEVGALSVPDEYRQWIWDNRDMLVGQDVKVRVQDLGARGVPRAGVFLDFGSESEAKLLMAAEAGAAGSERTPKEVMFAMKSAAGWRKK